MEAAPLGVPPGIPPVPLSGDLGSMLEQVMSHQIQQLRMLLHHDLQKEMSEVRSLIKAAAQHTAPRPKLKRGFSTGTVASGLSSQHDAPAGHAAGAATFDEQRAHAWVGRNVRSYAAAAEIAAMKGDDYDDLDLGPEILLPREIPKGSGPLARSARRAYSSSSQTQSGQLESAARSAAEMRHKTRIHSAPAWESTCEEPATVTISPAPDKVLPSSCAWLERPTSAGASSNARSSTDNLAVYSIHSKSRLESELSGDGSSRVSPSPVPDPEMISEASEPSDFYVDMTAGKSVMTAGKSVMAAGKGTMGVTATVKSSNTMLGVPVLPTIPSQSPLSFGSFHMKVRAVRKARPRSCRRLALQLVSSTYFDYVTVLFIMANACTIGVQTDYMARNLLVQSPPALQFIDMVFSVFFAAEVALRLVAYGKRFFVMPSRKWNVLDLLVVSMQLLEELMVALDLGESQLPVALTLMRMLRILRLVRVLRVVRLLRYMSDLRTLVVSIMSSMKPLTSAVALLALVIYMISIYFTQLALNHRLDSGCGHDGRCSTEHDLELDLMYGSVGSTIFHLFQSVTGGQEWRHLSEPLMQSISPWMGLIFCLYILFTSLALMNIVTGVFVESALQRGREDKDMYMINHLRELFEALDLNRNGVISWGELENHLDDPRMRAFFKDIDVDITEAKGLFDLLDRDGSGTIDADEFLSGCLRLRGVAKAVDLQLVMCELAEQRRSFQKLILALEDAEVERETDSSG